MGAWGAAIMGFFGAVFAALTMYRHGHVAGPVLAIPFVVFAILAVAAVLVIRLPGRGIEPSPRAAQVIVWSSAVEGVGLFVAGNVVLNLHRPEWLLPAMALVVGLHFLPIGVAAAFPPFLILGGALILSAMIGFVAGAPAGGEVAGGMAALCLWTAAVLALARDRRARTAAGRAASCS